MSFPKGGVALAALALAVGAAAAQQPQRAPTRVQRAAAAPQPFAVELVDARLSVSSHRFVAVTLRFRNVVQRPVTLAYVDGSGVVLDERGNRYGLTGPVRGIGVVSRGSYDPRFTLGPGESADARLEFAWSPGGRLFGVQHQLALAVRELVAQPGDQFRPGAEYALRFDDLGPRAWASDGSMPEVCGKHCQSASGLTAQVARVGSSKASGYQFGQVALRLTNTGGAPLVLCYASRSGIGADDRNNRYAVADERVRGIGVCAGGSADARFVLAPGASREVQAEYQTGIYGGTILGTVLDASLSFVELKPQPGDQLTIGRELPFVFRGLSLAGQAVAQAGPAPQSAPTQSGAAAPAPPATDPADACAGKSRCVTPGPFMAQVTSVAVTRASGYQFVKLGVRFRNVSSAPLILCYRSGSAVGTDERQNRYGVVDHRVHGIGLCAGGSADASFRLTPGQQRDATIEYQVGIYRGTVLGTTWQAAFTTAELEVLPGNQVQQGGEYVVSFDGLREGTSPALGGSAGEAANRVKTAAEIWKELRERTKKKP